jgi:maleamate amidohydrolase
MIMAEPDNRIWDQFITERDRHLFVTAGFGRGAGWGVRPALVVIDVTYAFTGEGEPVEESIKRYPLSCGSEAWTAIEYNRQVLDAAHLARIPVFYTLTELRPDLADVGGWSAKNLNAGHRSMLEGHKGAHIVDELAPTEGEIIISKKKPSAFFGTPLLSYLIDRAVDTVIVTGCTTSGCVRASVLDAFSYNYKIIVPEECCFDRGQASHAINLFDMQQKYADVVPTVDVIAHLRSLPTRLEEAPEFNPQKL